MMSFSVRRLMVLGLTALLFFFFQAEDGIRDRDVTGVQTCALPISYRACDRRASARVDDGGDIQRVGWVELHGRSEERRVGKECRQWGLERDCKDDAV